MAQARVACGRSSDATGSSSAAGGLRLSSSIAVDSVSVEDSIHEE